MWFTFGFSAACGLGTAMQHTSGMIAAAAVSLVLFLVLVVFAGDRKLLRCAAGVFLGCGIGLGWFLAFHTLYLTPVLELADKEAVLQITASDYDCETNYGSRVDGVVVLEGKPYQIRVYLQESDSVEPGDVLSGVFSLRLQKPEISTYFQSKGIYLFAYQTDDTAIEKPESVPLWCRPAILRSKIGNLLY